jgi:hypothetical protein
MGDYNGIALRKNEERRLLRHLGVPRAHSEPDLQQAPG